MNDDIFIDKLVSGKKKNIYDPLHIYKKKKLHRISLIEEYKKKLQYLLEIPIIPQKSKEWHDMRHNMITSSDWAQALGEGKFGTQKQLIKKKCLPVEDNVDNPFFNWGNMFEDVAISIYSEIHGVKIHHEFGLIQHPDKTWFGASPDGISDTGIMLEIKCPLRRKLDGNIPKQYYFQMQGQLDVCDLMECDYFECEFKKYENSSGFYDNFNDKNIKGIIIEPLLGKGKKKKYIYSDNKYPDYLDKKKYELFVKINQENIYKIYYWYLSKFNLKRIYRDQKFIDIHLEKLKEVWSKICNYRTDHHKFQIEVLKKLTIDTESFNTKNNIINMPNSYVFKDEFIEEIYF